MGGLATIRDDVVIFSDANSLLVPGAIQALLAHFSDPEVGGVCGQPMPMKTRRSGWLARAEQVFWTYDSALKRAENRLGGAASAQGTLYAMRRDVLPQSVPAAMADDFYISVQAPGAIDRARMARVDGDAQAAESVPARPLCRAAFLAQGAAASGGISSAAAFDFQGVPSRPWYILCGCFSGPARRLGRRAI